MSELPKTKSGKILLDAFAAADERTPLAATMPNIAALVLWRLWREASSGTAARTDLSPA